MLGRRKGRQNEGGGEREWRVGGGKDFARICSDAWCVTAESQHDEILFALAMALVYWKGARSCVVPLMSLCGRDFSMDYIWELRKLWIETL